jgi:hypothetical protein
LSYKTRECKRKKERKKKKKKIDPQLQAMANGGFSVEQQNPHHQIKSEPSFDCFQLIFRLFSVDLPIVFGRSSERLE